MAKQAGERVHSLDGLRGLGALIVLLFHIGVWASPFGPDLPYELVPGSASVMVFFVLSGVVLSLAPFKHLKGAGYDWFGYFPRRIIRLGVPLAGAMVFGIVAGYASWRIGSSSRIALAVDFAGSADGILHDLLMQFDFLFNVSDAGSTIFGTTFDRVNGPAWSMSWEIWFSLTLPIAIWCIARIRRVAPAVMAILVAVFISHWTGYFPLRLCLMFWIGVLMARHFDRLKSIKIPPALEALLLTAILVVLELPQLIHSDGLAGAVLSSLMDAACALMVVISVADGFTRRALSSAPVLFLGKISYSLYLTHAIVIGSTRTLVPHIGIVDPLAIAGISIAASFAFAIAFWRLVERPSISWSHSVGIAPQDS